MEWEEAQHFPKDLMSALGLMGVVVQEEYGGLGVPVQA
jgi:alkylation response protein AidB-like acyl-CoA dehydrogenase